ncbi:hypothetical protein J6590_064129 [Homalodisca vitripennis]|nr:hypothetical protein J6590_064129 [Homalodisca vitripennis]
MYPTSRLRISAIFDNPNAISALRDGPDYTFRDKRPTPYGQEADTLWYNAVQENLPEYRAHCEYIVLGYYHLNNTIVDDYTFRDKRPTPYDADTLRYNAVQENLPEYRAHCEYIVLGYYHVNNTIVDDYTFRDKRPTPYGQEADTLWYNAVQENLPEYRAHFDDYTFRDKRPTPYGIMQYKRICQSIEHTAAIIRCNKEIDLALQLEKRQAEDFQAEVQSILDKKLKPKGGKVEANSKKR